jgi:N-acyl amino acid synthase of PEP-CTERM/exosortase system
MEADLIKSFDRYFEVLDATSGALLDEVFALRYQIYCVDHPFEDAAQFPDQRERDAYDGRAVHALLRHRPSGMMAGTVRLVLAHSRAPASPFPIELHCRSSLDAAGFNIGGVPRRSLAEISRFAVSKNFKRRVGEQDTVAGVSEHREPYQRHQADESRQIPHMILGLFIGIVRLSAQHGITHWYAVMEPSLVRLLTRFGIEFQCIGPVVDYHGHRQPCFAAIEDVLGGIGQARPEIWRLITGNGTYWANTGPQGAAGGAVAFEASATGGGIGA